MSILKKPVYPQKVEVVNQPTSENPQKSEITNFPLNNNGTAIMGQIAGISGTSTVNVRPASSAFIVHLDNILLLQGDGTFVPIPLNSHYIGINQTSINNMLASYKSAYSTLVSGVTAATLHYSKMTNTGAITSEVYNLKD